jgi:hypothetical protein
LLIFHVIGFQGGSDPLFASFPTVMRVSIKLLSELSDRLSDWKAGSSLFGDVLIALGPALKLYHQ